MAFISTVAAVNGGHFFLSDWKFWQLMLYTLVATIQAGSFVAMGAEAAATNYYYSVGNGDASTIDHIDTNN